MALLYLLAAFNALCSTLLKCAFPLGFDGFISFTKRCINTPSIPYSFIHLKCRSTVTSSKELNSFAFSPLAKEKGVIYCFGYSFISGQRSIEVQPGAKPPQLLFS